MNDIHMHIIPDVDDGAESLEIAVAMLQMAAAQGVTKVIATAHSDAFEFETEKVRTNYRKLKKLIKDRKIPVELYLGCEVYCEPSFMEANLESLNNGRIPTLNGTRYVLIDFYNPSKDDMKECLDALLDEKYIPVIAHPERYVNISMNDYITFKEMGCLLQLNVFSIEEEAKEEIKRRANELLQYKLVDFCGSDAHRISHRPPAVKKGIQYLQENYETDYVNAILSENANSLLLNPKDKDRVEEKRSEKNVWIDGMMGLVVGDALGMPVQFQSRSEVQAAPITEMDGYGTYDMPIGTWSDDSSMALATLVSIRKNGQIDLDDIMERFVAWLDMDEYTPFGESFDMGNTCTRAIENYKRWMDVKNCGVTGEHANGNGALMRIMPVCLFVYEQMKEGAIAEEEAVDLVHKVSALTHNHKRSRMACGIYYFLVKAILEGVNSLQERLQRGFIEAAEFYQKDITNYVELSHYGRMLLVDEFAVLGEDEIKSSGYVVDSLEAAVWCLLNTSSFEDCLLNAVNLGNDTDTVGAIAGGLAGLFYGYENIPVNWKESIVAKEKFLSLC